MNKSLLYGGLPAIGDCEVKSKLGMEVTMELGIELSQDGGFVELGVRDVFVTSGLEGDWSTREATERAWVGGIGSRCGWTWVRECKLV